MPTLDWIGKKAVVNHHRQVPYHLLKSHPDLSAGNPDSGNLLLQGDNLLALKALLPYYAGQVKCIYIDPPYNTGNENWVYNDNVNAPEIKKWLGKVVGGESEDLSRHDKWLCMMYPRLQLLHQMLREDGLIFVNLDDTESSNLRLILDEIFGKQNFLAAVSWEKRYTRSNNAKLFYSLKDTITVYRRSAKLTTIKEPRTAKANALYKNPDNDPRGPWMTSSYVNPATKEERENLVYKITNPTSGKIIEHPTHAWKYELEEHHRHVEENLLWWGKKKNAKYPRLKNYLPPDDGSGLVPVDLWDYKATGTTDEGGSELKSIFGSAVFDNPKPTRLLERIMRIACDKNSLILDSFAGSGTTGHAVMKLNAADGGNRRFILIEMEQNIAQNITAERLKRVIPTLTPTPSENPSPGIAIPAAPGFQFCTLAEPLFNADGQINSPVTFADLARHIFFSETGRAPDKAPTRKSPLIGTANHTAYYLLFNGILGDKRPDAGNVLTNATLALLPPHPLGPGHPRIIFGEASRLSPQRLAREHITFKQLPYELKTT